MAMPTDSHQRDTVTIKVVLEAAGWTLLSKPFSLGGYLKRRFTARLRYATDSAELIVAQDPHEKILSLSFQAADDQNQWQLKLPYGSRLPELLDMIMRLQDDITAANQQGHLTALSLAFPKTEVA